MFAGDLLVTGSIQKLQSIIDEEPPLVVSEKFAGISSQLPEQIGFMYYMNLERMIEPLLMKNKSAFSEDDTTHLRTLGAIGGALVFSEEGLKFRSVGVPNRSSLEILGDLVEVFIRIFPIARGY